MRLHIATTGEHFTNPSPKQLVAALRALDHREDSPFIVLSGAGTRFMQAWRESARRFSLEYRDGVKGPHWSAGRVGLGDVERAFLSYRAGDGVHQSALPWRDIMPALENERRERLQAAVWQLQALAVSVRAMNRGTAEQMSDANLLDRLTSAQRGRLQALSEELDGTAMKIHGFAGRLVRDGNEKSRARTVTRRGKAAP